MDASDSLTACVIYLVVEVNNFKQICVVSFCHLNSFVAGYEGNFLLGLQLIQFALLCFERIIAFLPHR